MVNGSAKRRAKLHRVECTRPFSRNLETHPRHCQELGIDMDGYRILYHKSVDNSRKSTFVRARELVSLLIVLLLCCGPFIALGSYTANAADAGPENADGNMNENERDPLTRGVRGGLRVGVARVNITPPVGKILGGYSGRAVVPPLVFAPSEGVHDGLFAKALVLDDGATKVALIGMDTIGVSRSFHRDLHDHVTAATGLGIDQIIIAGSHTHSGPGGLTDRLFVQFAMGPFDEPLYQSIIAKVGEAVLEADAALTPARIGWGATTVEGIAGNRDRPGDIIDTELGLVRIDSLDGDPLAVIANIALHGTMLGADNLLFSGDCLGSIQRVLERRLGNDTTVLYFNGAEGDTSPKRLCDDKWEACERIGERVADAALPVLANCTTNHSVELTLVGREFQLPAPIYYNAVPVPPAMECPASTHAAVLGINNELALATIPGEMTASVGLALKASIEAIGFDEAFLFGLANDFISYILSPEEYRAYEGTAAKSCLYGETLGAVVTGTIEELAWRVYSHNATGYNAPPRATFTLSADTVWTYEPVRCVAGANLDPDGVIIGYQWNFGDGATMGLEQVVEHAYAEPGSYNITLTVVDDLGAVASTTIVCEVNNQPPQSVINGLDVVEVGVRAQFTALGSNDPDGEIVAYRWEIFDGQRLITDDGQQTELVFETEGRHRVRLICVDDRNESGTASVLVSVVNVPPTAHLSAVPIEVVEDEEIAFSATGSTDSACDAPTLEYRWDFGDGSAINSTSANCTHRYPQEGSYTVTLWVVDDDGAKDSRRITVGVTNQRPTVAIVGPTGGGTVGAPMRLEAVANDTASDIGTLNYTWYLGNRTAFGPIFDDTVHDAGPYPVRLVVTDDDGAFDTARVMIIVDPTSPGSGSNSDPDGDDDDDDDDNDNGDDDGEDDASDDTDNEGGVDVGWQPTGGVPSTSNDEPAQRADEHDGERYWPIIAALAFAGGAGAVLLIVLVVHKRRDERAVESLISDIGERSDGKVEENATSAAREMGPRGPSGE